MRQSFKLRALPATSVGVDKIRELRGVKAAHNLRRGQFACTGRHTDAAREFAKFIFIKLIDDITRWQKWISEAV